MPSYSELNKKIGPHFLDMGCKHKIVTEPINLCRLLPPPPAKISGPLKSNQYISRYWYYRLRGGVSGVASNTVHISILTNDVAMHNNAYRA